MDRIVVWVGIVVLVGMEVVGLVLVLLLVSLLVSLLVVVVWNCLLVPVCVLVVCVCVVDLCSAVVAGCCGVLSAGTVGDGVAVVTCLVLGGV